MKKTFQRVLAVVAGVLLAVPPLSVSAAVPASIESLITPKQLYSTVVAVNEGGNCLIMEKYRNWVITQDEFHQLAGVDFDLKPGDVFLCYNADSVYSNSFTYGYSWYQEGEKDPMQVYFHDTATIKFLGTAQEFYGDAVKELTVTDTTKELMAMEDEDGEVYYTKDSYTWGWAESGESTGIPSGGYKVGDKVLCATVYEYQSEYYQYMSAVILEKTYEAEEPEYNTLDPIVIAVSDDGETCLLSDGSTVTQSLYYQQYGGGNQNPPDLKRGDVIYVAARDQHNNPSLFSYQGKAKNMYSDYVKELTVTSMDKNGAPVWRDEEGNFYNAACSYSDNWTKSGIANNGFWMRDFWVGDKALCVTGVPEDRDYTGNGAVILEITSEVDKTPSPYNKPVIVTSVSGDFCLLSNSVGIYQDFFHTYSGLDFDLEIGDVIQVLSRDGMGITILETYPGQYAYNEYVVITYYGKAQDYYADAVKELTITAFQDDDPVWSDDDGSTYHINEPGCFIGDYDGYDPEKCSIGDKALCYLYPSTPGYPNYAIFLEQTFAADYAPGDINGDGDVGLVDVISINKHLMVGKKLAPAGKRAADFDGNGVVDETESLLLLKYIIHIVDTLEF